MFEKITHVPLIVADQDRALKFYTETLGFVKVQDSQQKGRPRWLTISKPGHELEFILVKGDYVVDSRAPPGQDPGGNHWVFRTNDCRGDVQALRKRGVVFREPGIVEAPAGLFASFTDPDGNHLTLLEPRRAPAPDG